MEAIHYPIDISIIIVNYNSFDLLDDCLSSIQQFTHGCSYEIIVVDNASTEGDIEKRISKYPNVILIKNKINVGFAKANNIGLEKARGKYVLFLNNDTKFFENTIKIIFDFAESLKHDSFIGCKLLNSDGSYQISIVDFDSLTNSFGENFFIYKLFPKSKLLNRFHLNYKEFTEPIQVDVVKGAFIFCSANSVKKLNGFDSRFYFYGEETDLCWRFKKSGGKVFYYPLTSIFHVGGATTDKNLWFKFKNQSIAKIQIYQKHYNGITSFLLQAFHFVGILLRVALYFASAILTFKLFLIKKSFYYLRCLFVYPRNIFN